MDRYDVIVIGAGVMGAAAAYHLAKRGRRVLLIEQFPIAHERGSSHGHSRIFRFVYDVADYVQLARAALPLWRELEHEAGVELLVQTGGLTFADPPDESIRQTMATLRDTGVAFEPLDAAAMRRRFPQFVVSEGVVGFYQADTGILHATNSVLALVGQARRHGAVVKAETAVLQVRPVPEGVEVRTADMIYGADRLVVTAGSWAGPLLRQIGLELPLTVTREQFAYFRPHEPALFEPGRCPVFIQHVHDGPSVYGFPMYGLPGVKAAFHGAGPAMMPESDALALEPGALAALHAHMERWMPRAAGEIILAQTCRYTTTPDQDFIVDRHPHYPQIVVGSPCSGHGFKFGTVIGAILADLAEHGTSEHPIGRFGLARFG